MLASCPGFLMCYFAHNLSTTEKLFPRRTCILRLETHCKEVQSKENRHRGSQLRRSCNSKPSEYSQCSINTFFPILTSCVFIAAWSLSVRCALDYLTLVLVCRLPSVLTSSRSGFTRLRSQTPSTTWTCRDCLGLPNPG